ncbi:MAG: hypothetical protein IPN34_24535 [Planctomycetes bacterium]|nr:hypothetical protein [Planctomycetota bacterium]
MSTLFLCGAGNSEGVRLALRVQAHEHRWERIVLLDDDASKHGRSILGVEIAGPLALLDAVPRDAEVQNLVARTTRKRRAVAERLASYGLAPARLVHPAIDTEGVELCNDVVIYEHAVLGPEVAIGAGSVVFMGGVVGHESQVGAGCVIASNAVLNARVELGEGVYVGTNATILPEVRVGAWATIGAGAVICDHVPAGATVCSEPVEVVPSELMAPAPAPTSAPARPTGSRTALEDLVAAAWREVLQREVGLDERFFDAGGTSLLATCLAERLRRATSRTVHLTDVYRFVTVRTMAQHLATGSEQGSGPRKGLRELAARRSVLQRDL